MYQITAYQPEHERSWLICLLLSFFDTEYYDDVVKTRPQEPNSIQLVAVDNANQVIGLIDGQVDGPVDEKSGYIWELAIHPDHQRQGIAEALFSELKQQLIAQGVKRIETWTREDIGANNWYLKQGFSKVHSYWHLYSYDLPADSKLASNSLHPAEVQWHAELDELEQDESNPDVKLPEFQRKVQCHTYELLLSE